MKLFQQIRDKVPSIKVALTKQYSVNKKEMYYFSPFLILNFIFQIKNLFSRSKPLGSFLLVVLMLCFSQNAAFASSKSQNIYINKDVKGNEKINKFGGDQSVFQLILQGPPSELLISSLNDSFFNYSIQNSTYYISLRQFIYMDQEKYPSLITIENLTNSFKAEIIANQIK
jgi:hypothetical protein